MAKEFLKSKMNNELHPKFDLMSGMNAGQFNPVY